MQILASTNDKGLVKKGGNGLLQCRSLYMVFSLTMQVLNRPPAASEAREQN